MASEKKPSIYSDRGTIGSSDELDEYGVWVKSEPRVLSSDGSEVSDDSDAVLPELGADFEGEAFGAGFGAMELPDLEIPDDGAGGGAEEAAFEDFSIPDDDLNVGDGADDGVDEDAFEDFEVEAAESAGDLEELAGSEADFEDFSIPDDNLNAGGGVDEAAFEDFEAEAAESADDLEELAESDADFEDFSISDDNLNADDGADEAVFEDFEAEAAESADDLEEIPAGEADFDDLAADDVMPADLDSDAVYEAEGFTEIPIEEFEEPAAELTPAPAVCQTDLSTELLMKIAEELSSIKTELSSLKKEFAGIKISSAGEEKADAQHGGFFSEEEDEKIALTGDELDNILNTADFTEEAGKDAGADSGEFAGGELESAFSFPDAENDSASETFPLAEDSPPEMLSEDGADIPLETLSDEEDISGDEAGISAEMEAGFAAFDDDLNIEIPDSDLDNIEIELSDDDFGNIEGEAGDLTAVEDAGLENLVEAKDTEELQQLRVEGAEPMTPAPDDISYLEEEPPIEVAETDDFPIDISLEENLPEDIDFGDEAFSIDLEEEVPEETSLETPLEEAPEVEAADDHDHVEDEIAIDLSDAVIDEPDLSTEINENLPQEPDLGVLDDFSDEISIDLSDDDFDLEETADGGELDIADDDLDIADTDGLVDDVEFDIADDKAAGDEFEPIIPEAFAEDADEPGVSLDDDLETAAEELDVLDEPSGDELLPDDYFDSGSAGDSADIPADEVIAEEAEPHGESEGIPSGLKNELKTVLSYMDQLLESLPEEKIEEFARSEYFDTYKKLFKELGLV